MKGIFGKNAHFILGFSASLSGISLLKILLAALSLAWPSLFGIKTIHIGKKAEMAILL